ncbi:MAG: TetR/AcrR family transcriptional regulator [Candidatus Hodarchaeota archaeon]
MTSSSDTKKQILDAAHELLLSRGYNGFSYRDIANEVGVKTASIHYHFPSKEILGTALVERDRRRFRRWTIDTDAQAEDGWEKLDGFFKIFRDILGTGYRICTACVLCAEFNTLPSSTQAELRKLLEDELKWLSGVLADGRNSGIFQFEGAPEDKALLFTTALHGIMQISRTVNRIDFFSLIRNQLKSTIKATGQ